MTYSQATPQSPPAPPWPPPTANAAPAADPVPGFRAGSANVNGMRIHYRIGGSGPSFVLLLGYAKTGLMWNPLMPMLAKAHMVTVPGLPGAGDSRSGQGHDQGCASSHRSPAYPGRARRRQGL